MKKPLLLLSFLSLVLFSQAQKSIVVHFLYGSVPAKGFEGTEKKLFGGKKGGHVTIEADDKIIGFQPKGTCHIFGESKHANGYFRADDKSKWVQDTISKKYASVVIPLTDTQYVKFQKTYSAYLHNRPYDYAVFGMRCAAAAYDILEKAGVVKKRSRFGKWTSFFYPQLLRRRMLRLAEKNNYAVVKHNGRKTRDWEKE
jgi:hypothetical protein